MKPSLALGRRAEGAKPEDVDETLVARLSALPEDAILNWFWLMNRQDADRLWTLLQLTHVVVTRPVDWDRAAQRREHEQSLQGSTLRMRMDGCFACGSSYRALYFHHLVEIQNGGSNAARNKVPLCFECHKYLHPWLKSDVLQERRGFEQVAAVMRRVRLEPIDREESA